jgi:signal transduction histidine kinase
MSRAAPPDVEARLALAHALRTPLTSLALGLGLLDDGSLGPLSEAQREVVGVLAADVARMAMLVQHDLRIERLGTHAGPVERVRTDLGAFVTRSLAPLSTQAHERAVEIEHHLRPDIRASLDLVKMGWVVASLVGSALRHSPRGGVITLRLTGAAGAAALSIADHGPGMPPEVVESVFERGGGQGLFLVREIVEAHGGTIELESEVGRGSTFTIKLPAEHGEETP